MLRSTSRDALFCCCSSTRPHEVLFYPTSFTTGCSQATLTTPPAPVVSMMRGLLFAYAVIVCAYFPVAISGYAAFGSGVDADVLLSIAEPRWLIRIANVMVTVHVGASWQVFFDP